MVDPSISSSDVKHLFESINERYGFDFTEYSQASAIRRIERFMVQQTMGDFALLAERMMNDATFFARFVEEFTVNVTEMFRDPDFYMALRKKVVPRLATYPIIKIWVAGCSTGEEAYSMAILMKEAGLLERTVIYATDINQRSLRAAKDGVIGIHRMKENTRNYLGSGGQMPFSDYYTADHGAALIDRSLVGSIVFSNHNLTTDRCFNEFQLILCRNVLIYFNKALQSRVISLFHQSLCPYGFLALGAKESLIPSDNAHMFNTVSSRDRIFARKE